MTGFSNEPTLAQERFLDALELPELDAGDLASAPLPEAAIAQSAELHRPAPQGQSTQGEVFSYDGLSDEMIRRFKEVDLELEVLAETDRRLAELEATLGRIASSDLTLDELPPGYAMELRELAIIARQSGQEILAEICEVLAETLIPED